MKKLFFILLAICLTVLSCKKNETNNLRHVKTEISFSGCGGQITTRNYYEFKRDTAIITISKDFINVFVNVFLGAQRYEPFKTKVEVIDDILCMYIIDLCYSYDILGNYKCYGRCGGAYTFDFVFKYKGEINMKYKIFLISHWRDYSEDEPFIISEGTINSKND